MCHADGFFDLGLFFRKQFKREFDVCLGLI